MSPIDLPYRPLPLWYWLVERIWRIEHALERAKARRIERDAPVRIFFVLAVFSAAFFTLAVAATNRALFSGDGRAAFAPPAAVARADLTDRRGQLLALDIPHFALYVDPADVWSPAETRKALGPYLTPASRVRLEKAFRLGRRAYLLGGLTPKQRSAIHDLGLPGVVFEKEDHRVYPLGASAAHLIGFTDTGGGGISGAEMALDDLIRSEGRAGRSVPLSIDLRIQAVLEDELRRATAEFRPNGAVALVTNVRTGEILGMANWPEFNPNDPGGASNDAKVNRAAAAVYEMGSTFKAFTVAIGLDAGVADLDSTFDATKPFQLGYRTIHDFHAANRILTLVEVFQHSSNIGTAKLGEAIGPDRLSHYFAALGLTRPAKVELAESARPLTPRKWNLDAVASTSFGHGMNVSPLALAGAMGAVLNGGVLVPLTIRKVEPGAEVKGTRALSPETSAKMIRIMRANVTGGSGKRADAPGLSVGGKTGTGEKYDPAIRAYSGSKQVSSFAAVFPTEAAADADRYFVLILLDEPRPSATTGKTTGGLVAAPAAGRVIDRIAPFLGVPRVKPQALQSIVVAGPAEPTGAGL